jgi:formate-nitrite transporter family protein
LGLVLAHGVIATLTSKELPHAVTRMLVSLAYAVGFIFVVIGRSELFTTSAALPVLSCRANVNQLLRLWGIVLNFGAPCDRRCHLSGRAEVGSH